MTTSPESLTSAIVVGIDGSPDSLVAGAMAGKLATSLGATVHAVHACGLLDVWSDDSADEPKDRHHRVRELMNGDWTQSIRESGVEPVVVLRDGTPVDVLIDVADRVNAALIVVGSRGESRSTLSTLGSTAATLATQSHRPTVVVPRGWVGTLYAGIERDALMINGHSVHIAPATIADLDAVRDFYAALSDTSTYYRFFGIRRVIPESELRAVVDPDVSEHVTLLATIEDEVVGIGEFIVARSKVDAEVAFAVADNHHREGIATILLEGLVEIARRLNLATLTAVTLPGNYDMLLVFRTVGLKETAHLDDDGVIAVSFDLQADDEMEQRSSERRRHAISSLLHEKGR